MRIHPLPLSLIAAGLLNSCKDSSGPQVSVVVNESTQQATPAQTAKAAETKKWPPSSETIDPDLLKENYLVVLDDSGSMAGEKIAQAKEALLSLAQALPAEHNLGLVLLNNKATVPLQPGNRESFIQAIKSANANGGTPLKQTTKKAYDFITKKASAQRGYGSYHLIIVTDGESSDGSAMPLVNEMVNTTSVQVHVIGFHLQDHEMNQPDLVDYRTAGSATELTQAFQAVTAEAAEFSDPKEFSR